MQTWKTGVAAITCMFPLWLVPFIFWGMGSWVHPLSSSTEHHWLHLLPKEQKKNTFVVLTYSQHGVKEGNLCCANTTSYRKTKRGKGLYLEFGSPCISTHFGKTLPLLNEAGSPTRNLCIRKHAPHIRQALFNRSGGEAEVCSPLGALLRYFGVLTSCLHVWRLLQHVTAFSTIMLLYSPNQLHLSTRAWDF